MKNVTRGPIARSADLLSMVLIPILRDLVFPEDCDSAIRVNGSLKVEPEQEMAVFSIYVEVLSSGLDHGEIVQSIWNQIIKNANIKGCITYLYMIYQRDVFGKCDGVAVFQ